MAAVSNTASAVSRAHGAAVLATVGVTATDTDTDTVTVTVTVTARVTITLTARLNSEELIWDPGAEPIQHLDAQPHPQQQPATLT